MRFILFWIAGLFFLACRSRERIEISFPEGGFPYPRQNEITDENFFQYPVKNIISTRDSFWRSYYDPYFFNSFHEPNLSLRPPEETTFRFSFVGALGYEAVLTMTQNKLYVKATKTGCTSPYPHSYIEDSLTTLS